MYHLKEVQTLYLLKHLPSPSLFSFVHKLFFEDLFLYCGFQQSKNYLGKLLLNNSTRYKDYNEDT